MWNAWRAGTGQEASRREKGRWELREGLSSRLGELEALLQAERDRDRARDGDGAQPGPEREALLGEAFAEVEKAKETLRHAHRRRQPAVHIAVAQTHYDTAHTMMLRLVPATTLSAMVPGLLAYVREHLTVSDERRVQSEQIALSVRGGAVVDEAQRQVLVDAMGVARQAHLKENLRVRSFTQIVYGVTAVLAVVAVLVAVFGALSPRTVPLCFKPQGVGIVCATGSMPPSEFGHVRDVDTLSGKVASRWDYAVVAFVGMVSAAIASAASLRRIRGSSTPYNVPVALALLKLPTGALTAVLGILLMRGQFVPGLQSLDSSAQIIAWAVIFGYAQQLFTRFVDNQAQTVLNSVGGPSATPVKQTRDPQVPPA